MELAVRQAADRGLTTRRRLTACLPAKWQKRVDATLDEDPT